MEKSMNQLPERYRNDYELKDEQVKIKKDYKFKSHIDENDITIPKEHIIVTVTRDKDQNIKRLSNKVSHAYLLSLKEKFKIKFGKYDLIADPTNNTEGRGYVRIPIEDTNIVGDGEILTRKLQGDFEQYAFTILFKRAEDRAIAKHIGLYSEGFLTESELLPETDTSQYDNLSIGKVSANKEKETINNVNNDSIDISLLLIKLLKIDNANFNILLKEFAGTDDIYKCTEQQQKDFVTLLEEKFKNEDQLRDVLIDYIKEYKTTNKWSTEKLLGEIQNILDFQKVDFKISDVSIDDCYDVVLDLGMHV